jgi:hypothetical protein
VVEVELFNNIADFSAFPLLTIEGIFSEYIYCIVSVCGCKYSGINSCLYSEVDFFNNIADFSAFLERWVFPDDFKN